MSIHPVRLILALALVAGPPALAQRRSEPDIVNAPHAPIQEQRRSEDIPLDVYIAPQIGGGWSGHENLRDRRGLPGDRSTPGFEPVPRDRPHHRTGYRDERTNGHP